MGSRAACAIRAPRHPRRVVKEPELLYDGLGAASDMVWPARITPGRPHYTSAIIGRV